MQQPDKRASTARSWCLYRPKDGEGDPLRIYNTTTRDVDLVVSVKGKEYMLAIMEWINAPKYVPQAGDMVFRFLTAKEREEISTLAAKTRWKRDRRKGLKGHKRDMQEALRRKLVIFTLDAPMEPDEEGTGSNE